MSEVIDFTFAICTKDRPNILRRCLSSVVPQLRTGQELIIVDNSEGGTAQAVASEFGVRWTNERRIGASWARNKAYKEAKGRFVVYVDDDCIADAHWAAEIIKPFALGADIVTGAVLGNRPDLAIPHLIDTEYSFHRGWEPNVFRGTTGTPWSPLDIWRVGVGGNMAWRRSLLDAIGGFDPALGAGTPPGSAEDIDGLRRALKQGAYIHYHPRALVWHEHPEHLEGLKSMLWRYSITAGAHLYKVFTEEHDFRAALFLVSDWIWQVRWGISELLPGDKKNRMPGMTLASLPIGSLIGMFHYIRLRKVLRDGTWRRTKMKASNSQQLPLDPPKSGMGELEVDLQKLPLTHRLENDTRVLLRLKGLPVFDMWLPAGTDLSNLTDRLPKFLRTEIENESTCDEQSGRISQC